LVVVIVAPGTKAPDESCTKPVIVALLLCPAAIPMERKRIRTNDAEAFHIS
jgi:hypothetical protein